MSWPNIIFSEEEKIKFQKMALELEQQMAVDSKDYEDVKRFSMYPPLVEAISRAKEKKIIQPFSVPNTNYWFFETNLQYWTRTAGAQVLAKFLLAIEGFPYEETNNENNQK